MLKGLSKFAINVRAANSADLPLLAAALAGVYLVYVLFITLSGFMANDGSVPERPIASVSEPSIQNPPLDFLEIANWHLFGQSPGSVSETSVATQLQSQFKLLGILFLSSDPGNASGIIQTDDGQQKKFKLGDELAGGRVLHAVERDRVLLKRGEHIETIVLRRDSVQVPKSAE